jgi:hypothetical protein
MGKDKGDVSRLKQERGGNSKEENKIQGKEKGRSEKGLLKGSLEKKGYDPGTTSTLSLHSDTNPAAPKKRAGDRKNEDCRETAQKNGNSILKTFPGANLLAGRPGFARIHHLKKRPKQVLCIIQVELQKRSFLAG